MERSASGNNHLIPGLEVSRFTGGVNRETNHVVNCSTGRYEKRSNAPGERQEIQGQFIRGRGDNELLRAEARYEIRCRARPGRRDDCRRADLLCDVIARTADGVVSAAEFPLVLKLLHVQRRFG